MVRGSGSGELGDSLASCLGWPGPAICMLSGGGLESILTCLAMGGVGAGGYMGEE